MQRKIFVNAAQPGNEVVFERANSTFGGVAPMKSRGDQLKVDVFVAKEFLEGGGAFVIESMELGAETGSKKSGMNYLEGTENAWTGATSHGFDQNTVAVVVVDN